MLKRTVAILYADAHEEPLWMTVAIVWNLRTVLATTKESNILQIMLSLTMDVTIVNVKMDNLTVQAKTVIKTVATVTGLPGKNVQLHVVLESRPGVGLPTARQRKATERDALSHWKNKEIAM